jgi:hypothetical protein
MKAKAEAINLASTFCFAIAIVVCSSAKSQCGTNLTPEEAEQEALQKPQQQQQRPKTCPQYCEIALNTMLNVCGNFKGFDLRDDADRGFSKLRRECIDREQARFENCLDRCKQ